MLHGIMTHVFVTGTRGIPDVPGGIETHCRDLYPLIVEKGYQITVAGRKSYLTSGWTRWKCRRIVRLGLRLAEELFSAPVPERISETIQKDQAVKKVAGAIMDRLLRDSIDPEEDPHTGRFSFMHLRLKDSFFEKVRYAVKLAFSPTKKEWLHYPLPAKWSFLHYVLRPYRLARAGLGK